MSTRVKAGLALVGIAVVALGLAGFIMGAVGWALLEKAGFSIAADPFLKPPHVELPASRIFPISEGAHIGEKLNGGNQFFLTNTILSSLIASLLIIVLFVAGTVRTRLVPGRLQGLLELIVEGLLGFIESVVGPARSRQIFPIIATIFLFVLFNAWIGLLPVYQALGFDGPHGVHGHALRPAGTDINMPLALALVSFVLIEYLGIRAVGLNYFSKFFRFGNLIRGRIGMGIIDLFVGVLELLSEFIRIVSFTFRLFGNMTAGEILLLVSGFLVSFVFTIPFYGLELLVGFIQALIFAGLTLVFISVAVTPHEHEEEHG